MAIIKVDNLSKHFKVLKRKRGLSWWVKSLFHREYVIKKAVDDISFSIDKGELVGYIGPNGAGKSTTIKMLAGILVPTGGSVNVNGLVPYKNRKSHAMNIGVIFKVCRLVYETYKKYNSKEGPKKAINKYLSHYDPGKIDLEEMKKRFARVPVNFIAEKNDSIIGVIRGWDTRIVNLFVKVLPNINNVLYCQLQSMFNRPEQIDIMV